MAKVVVLYYSSYYPPQGRGGENSWVGQRCHGSEREGNSRAKIPRLAGQASDYLEKQLRDYKSGKRDNPDMQNFAKPLNNTERVHDPSLIICTRLALQADIR
jgi:hypothetical protein